MIIGMLIGFLLSLAIYVALYFRYRYLEENEPPKSPKTIRSRNPNLQCIYEVEGGFGIYTDATRLFDEYHLPDGILDSVETAKNYITEYREIFKRASISFEAKIYRYDVKKAKRGYKQVLESRQEITLDNDQEC